VTITNLIFYVLFVRLHLAFQLDVISIVYNISACLMYQTGWVTLPM